ncbi:MAG: ribosomal protein S18-alanine N-acetyltransferase [Bifidobacterium sp.]|jgi:ribosomal-protein-alanine N-acetyltransferase|nr:ribosomal protein S18-alanine N-acetyltransferase [Bifidobacterium sp.]MCI1865790.1 ribosomal protein S18-alanine N-acetyltransferase [Bifidobacterium sp.]
MLVRLEELDLTQTCEQVVRLERELFAEGAWSRAMLIEEFNAPSRTYLFDVVSEVGHGFTIRGYAGYWFNGEEAEIMTLAVGKDYQRLGIASALLAAMMESARGRNAWRMLLEVRVDNDAALALYRRFGFTRLGLRKRYYQPQNIDAYTMQARFAPRVVGFTSAHANDGSGRPQ